MAILKYKTIEIVTEKSEAKLQYHVSRLGGGKISLDEFAIDWTDLIKIRKESGNATGGIEDVAWMVRMLGKHGWVIDAVDVTNYPKFSV